MAERMLMLLKSNSTFLQMRRNSKSSWVTVATDSDCDHSAIGDAKLLNAQALAVEPANKLPTIWGHLKDSY